jgi:hypothetical protein
MFRLKFINSNQDTLRPTIYIVMLQTISLSKDAYFHALLLLNVAEIQLLMGMPNNNTWMNINLARSIHTTMGLRTWLIACDVTLAQLYLRERNLVKLALKHRKLESVCLEQLANASQWGANDSMFGWTTIFLIHSLKWKKKLQVHKALQFFGDLFLHESDEDSAISLFTVALTRFTYIDVHQSRVECMLRLGDLSKGHGDQLGAMKFWEAARPLFECSSQAQQVQHIDFRLTSAKENVEEIDPQPLWMSKMMHSPEPT